MRFAWVLLAFVAFSLLVSVVGAQTPVPTVTPSPAPSATAVAPAPTPAPTSVIRLYIGNSFTASNGMRVELTDVSALPYGSAQTYLATFSIYNSAGTLVDRGVLQRGGTSQYIGASGLVIQLQDAFGGSGQAAYAVVTIGVQATPTPGPTPTPAACRSSGIVVIGDKVCFGSYYAELTDISATAHPTTLLYPATFTILDAQGMVVNRVTLYQGSAHIQYGHALKVNAVFSGGTGQIAYADVSVVPSGITMYIGNSFTASNGMRVELTDVSALPYGSAQTYLATFSIYNSAGTLVDRGVLQRGGTSQYIGASGLVIQLQDAFGGSGQAAYAVVTIGVQATPTPTVAPTPVPTITPIATITPQPTVGTLPPAPPGGTTRSFSVQLYSGWNLVSAPFDTSAGQLTVVSNTCQPIGKIWTYDTNSGQYVQLASLDMLKSGQAAWYRVASTCQVTFSGTPLSSLAGHRLGAGWNLIGAPYWQGAIYPWTSMVGSCQVLSGPWQFNTQANVYRQVFALSTGRGHWVRVSSPCTLS